MSFSMIDVPHFATPFRVVGSAVVTIEQDSLEEISDCVEAVLRTTVGSRIDEPDYGIPEETFAQLPARPSAEPYLDAVEAQEPRARLLGDARLTELANKNVTIKLEDQGV